MQERWDDADAEYCQHPGGEASATLPSSSQEAGRAKRFLPFSLGRRDCVGQSLARMNMTATIATLLSEFSFCLADEVLLLLLSASHSLHGCRCCTQQSGWAADERRDERARAGDIRASHPAACQRPAHALPAARPQGGCRLLNTGAVAAGTCWATGCLCGTPERHTSTPHFTQLAIDLQRRTRAHIV